MNIAKLKPFDKIEIIRKCTGFTPTQKVILFCIASHLGNNYFSFLSLTTLQKETGLSRACISDNLKLLINAEIIFKRFPGDGYKSNRYAINYERLVVLDYQCSSLGLLVQSPRTTRLVVQDYPKRNIKKVKESERDNLSDYTNLEKQKANRQIEIKNIIGKLSNRMKNA